VIGQGEKKVDARFLQLKKGAPLKQEVNRRANLAVSGVR